MLSGLSNIGSFDFQFLSGQMPTKADARAAIKPGTVNAPSLYNLVRNLELRDSPSLLCNISLREATPNVANSEAFPDFSAKLSRLPIEYGSDFDFYNEGQADWFIFTIQTYVRKSYPLIDNNSDSIPAFIAMGLVGDLESGADVEMNQRNITADLNLKSSDLRINFDRLIRMEV